jgi:SAM-dependent methyltransferase
MTVLKKNVLVLGSAGKPIEGAITLDIDPEHHPDVVHDLHDCPWPFETNQFDEVVCHHVLEHLNDLAAPMAELHRICKPEGTVYIEVPHHSSWCAKTPDHKLYFSYFAFDGYIGDIKTWRTGKKFRVLKREISFHRAHRQFMLHKIFNARPVSYERFWTYMFPAEHFKIWLQPVKADA